MNYAEYDWTRDARSLMEAFEWDLITQNMDDDIREQVHSELAPCSELAFLVRYLALHWDAHGVEFKIE